MSDAILQACKLCKSFGALKASDDISLDLHPGEIHAVIGPNGAGKSSLIGQLAGSLTSDSGQVRFLGKDISHLSVVQRSRLGLGRTFQISALAMDYTVLENVLLGALGQRKGAIGWFRRTRRDKALLERACVALERVQLIDRSSARVAELSHGQRRQLEIAVALTLSSKAFLMDEPMAGLGAEGSVSLTGFLDELRTEAPILLVEHDMDAVFTLADRVSVLVHGRVLATGTVDQIRRDSRVREAYLGDGAGA